MTVHGLNVLDPIGHYPTVPVRALRLWDCGVAWKDLNPDPGIFQWSRLDSILAAAEAAGARDICLVLSGTPRWAASDPAAPHAASWIGPGSNSPPRSLGDWEEFVRRVAARYKGRIGSYQIWNEPQLAEFWFPYHRIPVLASMTARAKVIIGKVDPQARVVSAPVLPRPSSGGMKRAAAYLIALKKAGWPVDVLAAHLYPEVGAGPARWRALVESWRTGLMAVHAPRVPLWVTETNYNLTGGPLTAQAQRRDVLVTDRYAEAMRVSRVYWYAWGPHSDPLLMGVRFLPGSPGARALERVMAPEGPAVGG